MHLLFMKSINAITVHKDKMKIWLID